MNLAKASHIGQRLQETVEASPHHREANAWVHTMMTLNVYLERFAPKRTEREQLLTLMALCFHDFGKPEAEETLEKKDQPGVMYRRYAGHESVSGNEFMSFICDQHELRQAFFDQGYDWSAVRKIKFMIEHHLPYGLKNPTKRHDLRQAIALTLGDEEAAFWDMLRSDAAGRISDNHAEKLQAVEDWISEFEPLQFKAARHVEPQQKTFFVLVGVSGAGKSTWVKSLNKADYVIFSEDSLRLEYAAKHLDVAELNKLTPQERYDASWKFCHVNPESKYEALVTERFEEAMSQGKHVVLDRMNPTRKSRGKWIARAKEKGFKVHSVELAVSEAMVQARQLTRGDKQVPAERVHQFFKQVEVPWLGPEVDSFEVVPSF